MARSKGSKIELTAYDDLFETDESHAEANLSKIREIPIVEIDEFPDHPFKVLMDEDMEQLVDSVRWSGVMTNVINLIKNCVYNQQNILKNSVFLKKFCFFL